MKYKQHIFIKFDIGTPLEEVIDGLVAVKQELEKIYITPSLYEEIEIFLCHEVDIERTNNGTKE